MKVILLSVSRRRRLHASLLAIVLGGMVAGVSMAGEGRGRMHGQAVRQAPFAGRGMRAERPAAMRGQPREQAREQPREQPMPQALPQPMPVESVPVERGRPGRLTPDERRALRQQINDAGRDLYRPPRP